jgi:hypothetical protein
MWQRPDGLCKEVVRRQQDYRDHAFAWRFSDACGTAANLEVERCVQTLLLSSEIESESDALQHMIANFSEICEESTLWEQVEQIESEGLYPECIKFIAATFLAMAINKNCTVVVGGGPLHLDVIIDELNQHLVISGANEIGTIVRQVVPRLQIIDHVQNVGYGIGPLYHRANPPYDEIVPLTP